MSEPVKQVKSTYTYVDSSNRLKTEEVFHHFHRLVRTEKEIAKGIFVHLGEKGDLSIKLNLEEVSLPTAKVNGKRFEKSKHNEMELVKEKPIEIEWEDKNGKRSRLKIEFQSEETEKRLDTAKQLIVYGEAYDRVCRSKYLNNYLTKTIDLNLPLVLEYKHGNSDITMLGSEHTHDPDSNIIKEIRKEALSYINNVPNSKRIFIVEGWHTEFGDVEDTFEKAVRNGGGQGGIVYLAMQSKTEIISPELSDKEAVRMLKSEGFTEEVIALHQFLKCAIGMMRRNENIKIHLEKKHRSNPLIYYASTLSEISEEWVGIIKDENSVSKVTSRINEISKNLLDGKELFRIEDDFVKSNINEHDFHKFHNPDRDVYPTNKTCKSEDKVRNEMLLSAIYESAKNGKNPFVLYGGNHIFELKPALDYLYGEPILR